MNESIIVILLFCMWNQIDEPKLLSALGFSSCLIAMTWIGKKYDADKKMWKNVLCFVVSILFLFLSLLLICLYPTNQNLSTLVHEIIDWFEPVIDEIKPILNTIFS